MLECHYRPNRIYVSLLHMVFTKQKTTKTEEQKSINLTSVLGGQKKLSTVPEYKIWNDYISEN